MSVSLALWLNTKFPVSEPFQWKISIERDDLYDISDCEWIGEFLLEIPDPPDASDMWYVDCTQDQLIHVKEFEIIASHAMPKHYHTRYQAFVPDYIPAEDTVKRISEDYSRASDFLHGAWWFEYLKLELLEGGEVLTRAAVGGVESDTDLSYHKELLGELLWECLSELEGDHDFWWKYLSDYIGARSILNRSEESLLYYLRACKNFGSVLQLQKGIYDVIFS